MRLFAIHAPAPETPEEARAARTGFSLAAFVFGPLWLLVRRAWLAFAVYAVAAAALIALVAAHLLAPGAAVALGALAHLYLGVEGRALALAARERAGRPLVDLVFARSALEAEKIYLDRALRPAPPAARRTGAAASDVIGLFPEPPR